MLFIPYFMQYEKYFSICNMKIFAICKIMQYFSYCKIKRVRVRLSLIYLSAFVTEICLSSSFAVRFTLTNYFLSFRCLFFKRLFYYNFFVILNDTIKVTAWLRHIMFISQSRFPTFNLNYMLCEYLQMFSDKINKCESRIFKKIRILLFKKIFMAHSSFYRL